MKVYLSGPIMNDPDHRKKFARAEAYWSTGAYHLASSKVRR
jgi:hypothetical protein